MMTYHSRDGVTSRLRMRGHDYASASTYFLTICTEHRVPLFGDVHDGALDLSPAGVVIDSWWHSLPARWESVLLDAMVVMPNHLHAVIHLGSDPTIDSAQSLSDVIRWFKIRTTFDYTIGVRTEAWPRFPGRLWQQGYYDRIIRDDSALERARAYIEDNPGKWADDEYNLGGSP